MNTKLAKVGEGITGQVINNSGTLLSDLEEV